MCRRAIVVLTLSLIVAAPLAAYAAPADRPYASDAHRAGPGGAYGGLKSRTAPFKNPGASDNANKEPYYYRYYSDTNRDPGSCRRFARRAIVTKNSNWWTRYRACLN